MFRLVYMYAVRAFICGVFVGVVVQSVEVYLLCLGVICDVLCMFYVSRVMTRALGCRSR